MLSRITRQHIGIMIMLSLVQALLTGTALVSGSGSAPAAVRHTQDEVILEPVGHFGGGVFAVAVPPSGGDYVYPGEGSGFTVLDVSEMKALSSSVMTWVMILMPTSTAATTC